MLDRLAAFGRVGDGRLDPCLAARLQLDPRLAACPDDDLHHAARVPPRDVGDAFAEEIEPAGAGHGEAQGGSALAPVVDDPLELEARPDRVSIGIALDVLTGEVARGDLARVAADLAGGDRRTGGARDWPIVAQPLVGDALRGS